MTRKFTTPCFIRKNTPQLRKKLEELGYYPHPSEKKLYELYPNYVGPSLHTGRDFYSIMPNEEVEFEIYCRFNEDRFLAIAALREDSDYMQWFTDGEFWDVNFRDDIPFCEQVGSNDFHKATVEEIIEHFK